LSFNLDGTDSASIGNDHPSVVLINMGLSLLINGAAIPIKSRSFKARNRRPTDNDMNDFLLIP
jgi:hypothetical protein